MKDILRVVERAAPGMAKARASVYGVELPTTEPTPAGVAVVLHATASAATRFARDAQDMEAVSPVDARLALARCMATMYIGYRQLGGSASIDDLVDAIETTMPGNASVTSFASQ